MISIRLLSAIAVMSILPVCSPAPLHADGAPICTDCHDGTTTGSLPDEHPAIGAPGEARYQRITELITAVPTSGFLAALHVKQGLTCSECHAGDYEIGTEISIETCLSCHGSYEQLAVKTEHPSVKSQNPHRSHLGEIDCVVCHHGHMASETYCLQCHTNFVMPIPADGS